MCYYSMRPTAIGLSLELAFEVNNSVVDLTLLRKVKLFSAFKALRRW